MKLCLKVAINLYLTTIIFSSCTSMRKIEVQVAEPPKYSISDDIKCIAVLNRSLTFDFVNEPDSVENLFKDVHSEKYIKDSIASDSAVIATARAIFESQRFDVVVPVDRNLLREDNVDMLDPLDSDVIKEICKDFKVDAVLVLEKFNQQPYGYFQMPWRRIIGDIAIASESFWRFYQPGQEPLYFDIPENNKLYWTGGLDDSRKEGYRQLPSIKRALIDGGIYTGWNIADKIAPIWKDQKRYYYYTGKKNIDEAIPLLKSNQWEEAAEIWTKYAEEESSSLRSKMEYNLALASEMTGDIDRAIEWGNKSLITKHSLNTLAYLLTLKKRKESSAKKNAGNANSKKLSQ